jgi:hypothetical protein
LFLDFPSKMGSHSKYDVFSLKSSNTIKFVLIYQQNCMGSPKCYPPADKKKCNSDFLKNSWVGLFTKKSILFGENHLLPEKSCLNREIKIIYLLSNWVEY